MSSTVTTPQETTEAPEFAAVREAAQRARAAAPAVRAAGEGRIDDALRAAASLIRDRAHELLDVNAADVAAAERNGMAAGLLDRLRLDPERLAGIATQLEVLAATPEPPTEWPVRTLETGERVFERRIPVGVIGAVFEARPNVTVDVASQVLKARSAAVLRTGSAALGSATALVEQVLRPALADAGLPEAAVQLVPLPGHAGAEALVGLPDLVPLVVVRGSGDVTRKLSVLGATAGTRVLAHADGGGVLYLDASATEADVTRLVTDSTDRLGVCNRLNLLLVDRPVYDTLLPVAKAALDARGIALSLPPHDHPLGHEWALDSGAEAHVTVAVVDGPDDAADTAARETSGLAATICAADEQVAHRFIDRYTGTGVFWNAPSRLLDGYKLLGLPETGINVDHTPGPRGPVTYRDLGLRQFVILPPEHA
ncbi:aldehyde dehydrogenase family protein [Pseudonocardia alni]|uniref:Glutamate-5-semialdehyde dehydrogenase n=1 Tax=Pseudonocardia alni TaxID=33907 RepID=A0A852VZ22_PSEA5|nr:MULTISPECIES: aldehyde dehydrogenase family protein [Pseudonocardia]MCM3848365.1 aldehyde dehydrogenase family protein [Pseudonocardia sp. DR1-2]NYG01807.1 glutamate-5-semialdehyde dehydrogenase [Pseudonocardia antarctica]